MPCEGLITTVIPVFNRVKLLRQSVESVLAQTWRPIEIIIVDDGSTDDTPLMIEALRTNHSEIVGLRVENGGPGCAREAGRKIARGEFIQYLDSDDLLEPRKFELQVAALRECASCDVSYGKTSYNSVDERRSGIPIRRTGERIEEMFPTFLGSRWWSTSTPLYRRSVTDAAGPWSKLRTEEDWEYDCRIAGVGGRLCYVDEFVSQFRDHEGERLSRFGSTDPQKLQDRVAARSLILQHAKSHVHFNSPEMQTFARWAFLLARQCGAAGLSSEAREIFNVALEASGPVRSRGVDFRTYGAVASVLGWSNAGRLSKWIDKIRK